MRSGWTMTMDVPDSRSMSSKSRVPRGTPPVLTTAPMVSQPVTAPKPALSCVAGAVVAMLSVVPAAFARVGYSAMGMAPFRMVIGYRPCDAEPSSNQRTRHPIVPKNGGFSRFSLREAIGNRSQDETEPRMNSPAASIRSGRSPSRSASCWPATPTGRCPPWRSSRGSPRRSRPTRTAPSGRRAWSGRRRSSRRRP